MDPEHPQPLVPPTPPEPAAPLPPSVSYFPMITAALLCLMIFFIPVLRPAPNPWDEIFGIKYDRIVSVVVYDIALVSGITGFFETRKASTPYWNRLLAVWCLGILGFCFIVWEYFMEHFIY
jgi:hypothetical protein